ncbi:MAG: hypothetical protein IJR20_06860 [Muribaculaceae bacterium]|nr:hypothetical protein [Muribaculaceae bacterium]
MKKRIVLICFIVFGTILSVNAENVTVTLNKYYSDTTTFVLPERTITLKMPCLTLVSEKYDFTARLVEIAQKIATDDYENKVFVVQLEFAGDGISVLIDSKDVLDTIGVTFRGDLIVEKKHFVLLETEDNNKLLKSYFKKERRKNVIFERTFEYAEDMVEMSPTHYRASYDERRRFIKVRENIVNGCDLLHPKVVRTEPKEDDKIDDSDAFSIDVEILEE